MRNSDGRIPGAVAGRQGKGWAQLPFRRFPGLFPLGILAVVAILILSLAACGASSVGREVYVTAPAPAATDVVATSEPQVEQAEPAPAASTPLPPTPTVTLTPPAPVAAVVNGQYIYLADYERRVVQFQQAMVDQGLDTESADAEAALPDMQQQVLDSLVDYVLIEQGGAAMGVSVSETDLENQIREDIAAGGGETAFEEWLQATGQTREDYKEMLRESLVSQQVMAAIAADIPDVVEQVHARQIVVDDEAAAQDVLEALRQGGDFETLVGERSVDVATRDNGGDLGWFPRGLVAPELETAAFALQPGEFSESIPLGGQYHIVQVVERDPSRALSAEEKANLDFAMFDRWLNEQRAKADIERFVGE